MVVRFLSATIAIPIVLAFMLLGNLWFLILMIFGAAISSFEASRLLKTRGIDTNPTVSASIGSVIVALAYWSGEINISLPLVILCGSMAAAGIGITLSILGQIGDLSESAIKRISGVKDSGGFMPGHGGALDRIDSIVLSLPVLYYLSYLFPKLVGT